MSEIGPTAISRPVPLDTVPGYRLIELVGRGGMGEVHKALQLSLERRVAVKLLAPHLAQDPGFVARFEKEAAALAQLSHPNIVSIVDKGKAAETYYLVMEFVEGPSLRELLKSGITPQAALRAVYEVARAIDYAHGRGIVHRDLKPENILIDAQAGNIAKVSDFGLAGFLDDGAGRFNVTATHVAMGTLAYMAPEQRVDAKKADHRADIYSLGVMLYELITGDVPMGSYAAPSQKVPGTDPRLDSIVERCLKPDPGDRYQKTSELLAELEPMVVQLTVPPKALTAWDRFVVRVRRAGRTAVRVTGTALVLAAATVLTITALRDRHRHDPELPAAPFARELATLASGSMRARVSSSAAAPRITLGDGPDQVTLQEEGRPVTIDDDALVFDRPSLAQPTGRVAVDTGQLSGQGVRLVAEVTLARGRPTLRQQLHRWLWDEEPEPRAAVTLLGSPEGRHATVVLGPPGTPVALDWNFGLRRGVMLGPASAKPAKGEPTELALEIDLQGNLRALVGHGADQRQVGEPIALGRNWRSVFGRMPLPQFGCHAGVCRFSAVKYEVEREPPPPAPAPAPEPAVASAAAAPSHAKPAHRDREKPQPKSHTSERRDRTERQEKSEKGSRRREGR